MHKTDLIWGGTWGGTANFWGGMCPPGPPLATPLLGCQVFFFKMLGCSHETELSQGPKISHLHHLVDRHKSESM